MRRKAWHIDLGFILFASALFAALHWIVETRSRVEKREQPWIILRDGDMIDGKPVCVDGLPGRDRQCSEGRRL